MNIARFHTLPTGVAFLDTLASRLLQPSATDPLQLARTLVLLPSRRACRNLHEAFLRTSDGRALLLPRIMPIGEVDGEADLAAMAPGATPAVMPEKQRLAMLTRLILKSQETTPARACELAATLAQLMDDVTKHGLSFDRLKTLVPEELATHWQKTTEFLKIITSAWPHILATEGMVDAAALQRDRILALASTWQESPPDFPVVAAGSTGSIPATAALLATIARLPQGMVILPGLDLHMPAAQWDALCPTHPQYGMRQLLDTAGAARTQVQVIGIKERDNSSVRAMFTPAEFTAHWREQELPLADDLSHIALAEAATQADEARMIACRLRETLDTSGKTAALVTPDRTLARMVAAECARYGLAIDDSAGKPLATTPPAIFMRLLLDAVESGFAPEPLLALLRHPLAAVGGDTTHCREMSRLLEIKLLRSMRLESGMDALIDAAPEQELKAFLLQLRDAVRSLEMLFLQRTPMPLATLLQTHCTAAEALAGAERLWAKEPGIKLAETIAGWNDAAPALGDVAAHDYPALFNALIARDAVRMNAGSHPRLHILSPIEARLLDYDLTILGEMSEGTWPAAMTPDPWMSAPMREQFGLPPQTMQVGQSAHDVWMMAHGKAVLLTRARKIAGRPQEPSRWWVRLVTLVGGKDAALLARMHHSAALQAVIDAQDAPYDLPPLKQPHPTPPIAARPTRFSVSNMDVWRHEPYKFYAQKILGLHPLPPLDQEPDAADFGEHIHTALEHFSAEHPNALPEHAYQKLMIVGERIFSSYANHPAVRNLWWPRFEAIARHWLARETRLRQGARYTTNSEVSAEWTFTVADRDVTLRARADRVDDFGGSFRLMDYKTGSLPTAKRVEDGDAMQLPLTALALMKSGTVNGTATTLEYWALKTRASTEDIVEIAPDGLLERTEETLRAMIEASLTEATDYAPPQQSKLSPADDYHHLIRRDEWAG